MDFTAQHMMVRLIKIIKNIRSYKKRRVVLIKKYYSFLFQGIPAGPYTQQDGIWGYLEILQAMNNDTLINLPDAKPHDWTIVRDDCYDAPYACE